MSCDWRGLVLHLHLKEQFKIHNSFKILSLLASHAHVFANPYAVIFSMKRKIRNSEEELHSSWQYIYQNDKKTMESLHSKYTTVQMFQVSKIFNVSKSLLCSPRLHLYDQEYSKNSNIVRYFKMYSCDGKAFT